MNDIELSKINILIVDNYKTMLRILESMLKKQGFKNIHTEQSGSKAIEWVENNSCDLIIADYTMEPITGLSFLTWVRTNKLKRTNNIPFIMLIATGKTSLIIEKVEEAGVSGILVKPFTTYDLKEKIKNIFLT